MFSIETLLIKLTKNPQSIKLSFIEAIVFIKTMKKGISFAIYVSQTFEQTTTSTNILK